jgi:hypothetical protein
MQVRSLALVLAATALSAQSQPPDPPPSFIAAPVRVDLAQVFAALERAAPRTPPGVEAWINLPGPALGGGAYRYNLYRDPLQFGLAGNRLHVHTTVNYWLQVGVRMKGWIRGVAACGVAPEPYRRAMLGLQADVGLTPGWGLDLKVTPDEPLRMDPCQVTAVGFDITDRVLAGMKDALVKATQGIEQQLRDPALLRPRVEKLWLQAQQPVDLGQGLYLALNPERIRLAPWRSEGQALVLTPEIQVRPSLVLGAPPAQAVRPLPDLDLAPAPIQPGFRVRVQADVTWPDATAELARRMAGQRFETDKGVFEVQDVAVRGRDGKLLLDLDLKGRVTGRLSLAGTPAFDPGTGTVRLDDLDYTLESRSWITRFGEWLYRSSLRRTLRDKCAAFLDQRFRDLRDQAQRGLNRDLAPGVAMAGSLGGLALDRIQVLEDRLSLGALLDGQVRIDFKPGF